MSGSKIVFIFLILVLVLFVVVEVIGAHNNSATAPSGCDKVAASDKLRCEQKSFTSSSSNDHSTLQSVSQVLEPFSPKAQVKPKSFTLNSSSKKEQQLLVAADDSHSFRKAEFTLLPSGCGTVTYTASGDVPAEFKTLSPQNWPDEKQGEKDDPSKPAKLIILKQGGTLDFGLRTGATTCEVTLQ